MNRYVDLILACLVLRAQQFISQHPYFFCSPAPRINQRREQIIAHPGIAGSLAFHALLRLINNPRAFTAFAFVWRQAIVQRDHCQELNNVPLVISTAPIKLTRFMYRVQLQFIPTASIETEFSQSI